MVMSACGAKSIHHVLVFTCKVPGCCVHRGRKSGLLLTSLFTVRISFRKAISMILSKYPSYSNLKLRGIEDRHDVRACRPLACWFLSETYLAVPCYFLAQYFD